MVPDIKRFVTYILFKIHKDLLHSSGCLIVSGIGSITEPSPIKLTVILKTWHVHFVVAS